MDFCYSADAVNEGELSDKSVKSRMPVQNIRKSKLTPNVKFGT